MRYEKEQHTYESINTLDGFMLPDPRLMSAHELRDLFVKISREFTVMLHDCKEPGEIEQLQKLQNYLRSITAEIELKDKSMLKSL